MSGLHQCPSCGYRFEDAQSLADHEPCPEPIAENDAACEHPYWDATSDGHTSSGWRCTTCGHWQWIAPWVLRPSVIPSEGTDHD